MRTRVGALLSLLLLPSATANADQPLCGTSELNDARIRAIHDRPGRNERFAAHAVTPPAVLQDGTLFVGNDEAISFGTRHFDLAEQSLVFEPREGMKFAVRREALRYVEPEEEALHDFGPREGSPWHYVSYDLKHFALPLFGGTVSRVYLSAFNGVHLSPPVEEGSMQFGDLDAAVHRDALISPLMITTAKPRQLAYPMLFVEDSDDALIITWRSQSGEVFGYDVQAELRSNGTIVYSYRTPREMAWGAPILTAGFDPDAVITRSLSAGDDPANDIGPGLRASLVPMLDIRNIEVLRVSESDLFKVRIRVDAPVNSSLLTPGESLHFLVDVGSSRARLELTPSGWRVVPFSQARWISQGTAARLNGSVIEIYGVQPPTSAAPTLTVQVTTYGPSFRFADRASMLVPFDLPPNRIASDFSSVNAGTEVALPVTEPFTLGALDVMEVWKRIVPHTSMSSYDVDAVAIYQTFYTDLVFYAGAYASGGNAQVGGISAWDRPDEPRAPTLLHMNQYKYSYNSAPESASQVLLHEFGHRWLYFFNIKEGAQVTNSLNPGGGHPAAYVHTPAAFRVYSDQEASVMGGAYFTALGNGMYQARVRNAGFSWTDLYLMGLASPEEVEPWYYLANTDPALPLSYWPPDRITVSGLLRPVEVGQIIEAHGTRLPDAALSQKRFRVLFVLVTDGSAPEEEHVAQMKEWRALLERNFNVATGGRSRVDTRVVGPVRHRSVR